MSDDSFKYGMPILCTTWPKGSVLALGGGGGSAKTGIKNRLVLSEFKHGHLSDQLAEMDFGAKFPVRVEFNPNGEDVFVAFGNDGAAQLRAELEADPPKLTQISGKVQDIFSKISVEIANMRFSSDGKMLVVGFSRGWVQIWEWPEMKEKIKCRDSEDYSALKDLDLNFDDSKLVTTSERGTCEIFEVETGKCLTELNKPGIRGARFSQCRFCPRGGKFLYTTLTASRGGYLCKWTMYGKDSLSVKLKKCVKVVPEAVTAIAVNAPGDMVAMGSNDGDVLVYTTTSLLPLQVVKEAHMVFVTDIAFQHEAVGSHKEAEAYVLSGSADASANITTVKRRGEWQIWFGRNWLMVFIFLFVLGFLILELDKRGVTPQSGIDEL